MNKVLSCYFSGKVDPQGAESKEKDNFNLMEDWYKSLHLLGLEGVIFHDRLSDKFIQRYKTSNLKFQKVELGKRELNDDRFCHYKNFLKVHPEIDKVFLTDLFDVEFYKDPFQLFSKDFKLYSGDELSTIWRNTWMMKRLDSIRKYLSEIPDNFVQQKTLNAGIIGGSREIVLKVIIDMIELFNKLPKDLNCSDMPIYNIVARDRFKDKEILHGKPLNSDYKKFEEEGEFAIKHK